MGKAVSLGREVPVDVVDLVGSVLTVLSHHNGAAEFVIGCGLSFPLDDLQHDVKARAFGHDLRYVVDDQVQASLENPSGSEKSGPCFNDIVDRCGERWIEKQRTASDLSQLRAPQAGLNDAVNEVESDRVVFHLELVEGI